MGSSAMYLENTVYQKNTMNLTKKSLGFLKQAGLILALALLVSIVSCTPANRSASVSDAPEEEYIYHRIKYSGETVAIISAWYTKSSKNWPEIVDANPKLVPSRMRIGDLVRIPKRLVRKFQSLPQEFVNSFGSGVNQDSSKATAQELEQASQTAPTENASDYKVDSAPMDSPSVDSAPEVTETAPEVTETAPPDISQNTYETDSKADSPPDSTLEKALDEPKAEAAKTGPADAPPANDENQKIRDQLMQELLQ